MGEVVFFEIVFVLCEARGEGRANAFKLSRDILREHKKSFLMKG